MSARGIACTLAFACLTTSPASPADEPPAPGEAGDACRNRAGCGPGLACRGHVCTEEREGDSCESSRDCGERLACIGGACMAPIDPAGTGRTRADWMRFRFTWLHPFLGVTMLGGPVLITGAGGTINLRSKALLWGLRAGVYAGRNELAVEVSPASYMPFPGMGPSFQLNGTYGYLFALRESRTVSVYWPMRLGFGLFAGNSLGLAFLQVRADLVGLAVRVGHVVIDLHAPSFRYATSFASEESLHFLTFDLGAGITYAF